jgi:hypothetical protein
VAWLPLILCLIVALALLVARGVVIGERAYAAFQAARDLTGASRNLSGLSSPLFVVLLAGGGKLGLPIPSTGLLLSAAGWLIAIATVYVIGLRFNRPVMAVFAAGVLVLEPTLPLLIGQGALFVMGWLWGALCGVIPSAKGFSLGPKREESLPRKQDSALYPTPPPSRRLGMTVSSVLALVVLAVSIAYHASQATTSTLWANYGPALLPGLALLAGLLLDKLVALTARLPFAWRRDERLVFEVVLVVLALTGLGYVRGTAPAWSSASREAAAERLALWEQAGLWLQKNTAPESTVWSDENGVLRYFSGRRVVGTAPADTPPDYTVTDNSLTWTERVSQPWFRERYRRVTAITNPYDSLAPLTIYRYRPSPFDVGQVVNVGAHFGESLELLSYRLDSTQLIPGEAQHLTLTWQALQPLPKLINVRVRLYASASRRVWAQVVNATPASARSQLWPAGRPLTDLYTLRIPKDLPPGAYQVEVQVLRAENEVIPETDIEHPLGDAVILARLEAQPWISDTPMTAAHSLTALFGEPTLAAGRVIELTGYTAPSRVERGEVLRVRLYWHAQAAPGKSYHVFTHLLTADNRLVAQQDSAPVYETYPTDQWKAGQYILDEHLIPIDAATPPGRYWLRVGLYTPESGERLIARDQTGREWPDRSVLLIQVEVE